MNRKLLWFIAVICMAFAGLHQAVAIPAYPHPVTYTQSDGTQITIRIYGDEYKNQVVSQDGYTLIGGKDSNYYFATLADDGSLKATSVMAKPMNLLSANERATVSTLRKGLTSLTPAVQRVSMPSELTQGNIYLSSVNDVVDGMKVPYRLLNNSTTTGKLKSLIILGEFSDVKFQSSDPKTQFRRLLMEKDFADNGATGSAYDYYYENSNGQFDPEFVVVGPFTAQQTATYYGAGQTGTEMAPYFIKEIIQAANAAGVDFSEYTDDKGIVRDIFIFYAGYNQADGGAASTIWPHRTEFNPSSDLTFGNAQIKGYACTSELQKGGALTGIGTFCHEFGHVLGWPDFYDTDYGQQVAPGVEDYSLMCKGSYNNNSHTPPAISILERWLVGWVEPQIFESSGTFEIDPVIENKGYIIPSRTKNDYFMVEYRGTDKNRWDQAKDIGNGTGMMVYHVDNTAKNSARWRGDGVYSIANTVNADYAHECYKLVRSTPGTQNNPGRTFFPGTSSVKTLTPTSNSLYKAWDGEEPLVHFNDIQIKDGKVVVKVTRMGGPAINLKVEAFQHDIILSWTDRQSTSWTVTLADSQGTQISQQTVEESKLHLKDLRPATNYKVTIEGVDAEGEAWAQVHTVTTQSRGGSARLGFTTSEFSKDTPILFTVLDYQGEYKEVQWYVDDKQTTTTFGTLPVGEHVIKAIIVNSNDSKEYMIKYITVK